MAMLTALISAVTLLAKRANASFPNYMQLPSMGNAVATAKEILSELAEFDNVTRTFEDLFVDSAVSEGHPIEPNLLYSGSYSAVMPADGHRITIKLSGGDDTIKTDVLALLTLIDASITTAVSCKLKTFYEAPGRKRWNGNGYWFHADGEAYSPCVISCTRALTEAELLVIAAGLSSTTCWEGADALSGPECVKIREVKQQMGVPTATDALEDTVVATVTYKVAGEEYFMKMELPDTVTAPEIVSKIQAKIAGASDVLVSLYDR